MTPQELGRISQPVLVAVGTRDDIGGEAAPLAALLPLVNVDKAPDTNCGAEIREATKPPKVNAKTPPKPVAAR